MQNQKKRDVPVYRMDFTWHLPEDEIMEILEDTKASLGSPEEFTSDVAERQIMDAMIEEVQPLKGLLEQKCSHFCFQLEKAPTTGRLHFQGRVWWKTKVRLSTIIGNNIRHGMHWSPTSKGCGESFDYVLKGETRVRGPWFNEDFAHQVPDQIARIKTLRPWQEQMKQLLTTYNERDIHIIVDLKGNNGKSTFSDFMHVYHKIGCCPPFNNTKDLIQAVCSMGARKAYIFDLPRAMNKDSLAATYAAIEQIKSGHVMDTRYSFKELLMTNPGVLVITNSYPDFGLLSADRWKVWHIINDKLVQALNIPRPSSNPSQTYVVPAAGKPKFSLTDVTPFEMEVTEDLCKYLGDPSLPLKK